MLLRPPLTELVSEAPLDNVRPHLPEISQILNMQLQAQVHGYQLQVQVQV